MTSRFIQIGRALALVLLVASVVAGQPTTADPKSEDVSPATPDLNWEPRSDWINVKTAGAKGDGTADDTAPIQATLDQLTEGNTIYFPPGTYRITKTLQSPPGRHIGVTLIGHGRSTTLAWDGEAGGRMFWSGNGMPNTRYVGLSWDGRGKAAVGFDHSCVNVFETEVRHQYEAYRNFTEAGIRVGVDMKVATAETFYDNCLFEHCGAGVLLTSFNVLDHTFDRCEFRHCGVGVLGGKGTNIYVRNSHFEQNTQTDIVCSGEQGSSVRRCTSHGSASFLAFASSVGPLSVQDCHIDSWSKSGEAVLIGGAPVLMFDCVFTHPPSGAAPVRTANRDQRLIVCNNQAPDNAAVVALPDGGKVIEIPAGSRAGVVKSATQRFIKSSVRIPGKVFDAKRDFGAKGDGTTDDTAAIAKAIEAARTNGNGAIAYLPTGRYAIQQTLELTGSNFYFGGSGFRTILSWKGKKGATTLQIHDPDHITLENIIVGHHDGGFADNGYDILQTGTGKPSFIRYDRVWVFGMYQNKPLEHGLRVENLGKDDTIHCREVNGNFHVVDSAAARIFLGVSYEGTLMAEGKSLARDGFLGGCVRLATVTDPSLWIKDNQSLVLSDFYTESGAHAIRMEGDATLPAGRVTLAGAKFELAKPENNGLEVDNYRGELSLGPDQFYVGNPLHRFVQKGDAPFALTILGGLFYNSKPDFHLSPAAALAVVGGESDVLNKADAIDHVPGAADTAVQEALPRISRALDDLRRLGEVDLEIGQSE